MSIHGKKKYLGCFKTKIEAAKCVNFVCKKHDMKIKNPQLSDEETGTFNWPLPSKKVAIFYTFLLALIVTLYLFFSSIDKCLLGQD